ncbi:MAG: hypothetical protein ABI882_04775 [Acidobacteriota bacterium]
MRRKIAREGATREKRREDERKCRTNIVSQMVNDQTILLAHVFRFVSRASREIPGCRGLTAIVRLRYLDLTVI